MATDRIRRPRPAAPLEREEAATLVAYLRIKNYKFQHIPNETGSSPEAKRRAVRMKQQGTSRGFPDYMVLVNGHAVFIELKRTYGSSVSLEQREWINALNEIENVQAYICKGAKEAIDVIEIHAKPLR